jgi:hypothetical protein
MGAILQTRKPCGLRRNDRCREMNRFMVGSGLDKLVADVERYHEAF